MQFYELNSVSSLFVYFSQEMSYLRNILVDLTKLSALMMLWNFISYYWFEVGKVVCAAANYAYVTPPCSCWKCKILSGVSMVADG